MQRDFKVSSPEMLTIRKNQIFMLFIYNIYFYGKKVQLNLILPILLTISMIAFLLRRSGAASL